MTEKTLSTASSKFSVTEGYRRYVLVLLLIVYVFNFIDRQIVAILLPHIKADLVLSDSQLGLLTGFAFAIFYVTFGIPIANLSDRTKRIPIIVVSVAVWSFMTAVCGMAQNFIHLVVARIGVGVGEAGCTPPAHSLIADYFPANRRAFALSIYSMGTVIGSGLGLFFGGWIAEVLGWRAAFVVVGLPGLLLALLVQFTIKEPPRGFADGVERSNVDESSGLREGVMALIKNPCFIHITIAASYANLLAFGFGNWFPSFFVRSFGAAISDIGIVLGSLFITCGGIGMLLGGYLGDRLVIKDLRWLVTIPMIGSLVGIPFLSLVFTSSGITAAYCWLIIPFITMNIAFVPVYALIQRLAPIRMRALAVAVFFFFINLIGLGGGPLVVGVLSDFFAPVWQQESLRYTMLILNFIFGPMTVLHFWLSRKWVLSASDQLRADLYQEK